MRLNSLGKLGSKLLSSIIVSALCIVVLIGIFTIYIRYALDANITGQRALDSIEVSSNHLYQSLIDQETGQRGYNLTQDEAFLDPYKSGSVVFSESSSQLIEKTVTFPMLYKDAQEVIESGLEWQDNYGKPLVALAQKGEQPSLQLLKEARVALEDFRITSRHFTEKIDEQRTVVRNTMRVRINAILIALVSIITLIILLNVWINFRILKTVIKPIIDLSNGVKNYTEHDFSKEVPVYAKQDELFELINNVDIMRTELSNSIYSLESKVNFDELTGLYNRRYFNELIIKEWKRAKDNGERISVILFDIDYYKNFNDTYGHLKGDECLKTISQCLQAFNDESSSYVSRFGGEEFIVLLNGHSEQEVLSIAERILKAIQDLKLPHRASVVHDYVTVSIGTATIIPTGDMQPFNIITMADKALYESKDNGRNQVTQFKMEKVNV